MAMKKIHKNEVTYDDLANVTQSKNNVNNDYVYIDDNITSQKVYSDKGNGVYEIKSNANDNSFYHEVLTNAQGKNNENVSMPAQNLTQFKSDDTHTIDRDNIVQKEQPKYIKPKEEYLRLDMSLKHICEKNIRVK
jgi:hypothetical protein